MRRKASTTDNCDFEALQTPCSITNLFRPVMTLIAPACWKGTQSGNSTLASFQENLEGSSCLNSYQLSQLAACASKTILARWFLRGGKC